MELNPDVEQRVRDALVEHLGSAIRLGCDGDIHPDEARAISSMIQCRARDGGYDLHPDWRIVVQLDLPASMLNITAVHRETFERVSLSDRRVWLAH